LQSPLKKPISTKKPPEWAWEITHRSLSVGHHSNDDE
jgi:hypothetical protein